MATVAYLDTHVVAWLFAGELAQLSAPARRALDNSELLVSRAVVLELQLLHEVGRATVGAEKVIDDLHRRLGLGVCDLPFLDVVKTALPSTWTRDPFDRLIVAQAACRDSTLVTKDRVLRRRYSAALW